MEMLTADLWRVHASTMDLLRFADTKAAAILTAEGVVLGIAVANIAPLLEVAGRTPIFALFAALSLLSGGVSFFLALQSLAPTVRHRDDRSLIYFAPIAKAFPTAAAYHEAVCSRLSDREEVVSELTRQIWVNSQIAVVKYSQVRRSIQALGVTVVFTACAVALPLF